jgi:hypothetical protein
MSDEQPSLREQEEAEALARALEGKAGDAPADALQIAALIRYSRGDDRPDPVLLARARERAVTASLRNLQRRAAQVFMGSLAAAAAVLLIILSAQHPRSATPQVAMEAPRPTAAPATGSLARLLEAQGDILAEPNAPLAELTAATAERRRELLASLSRHYEGVP